jgi:hypothetical protein
VAQGLYRLGHPMAGLAVTSAIQVQTAGSGIAAGASVGVLHDVAWWFMAEGARSDAGIRE